MAEQKNAVRNILTTTTVAPTSSTSTSSTTTVPGVAVPNLIGLKITLGRAALRAEPKETVLTQSPATGTVLHPGATVALTMHTCPQ